MAESFQNWSGSVRFTPRAVERPASTEEVAQVVRRARREGRRVRVVGALHSSSGVIEAEDVLVSLERMARLVAHDADAREATVEGGITIAEAGRALLRVGLMMPNWGDVDYQTVAGAVATGTHGSGVGLRNLATMLVGGRLVTGAGEVVAFGPGDAELLRAARCSLGALGILTELRLRLEPAFRLRRQEWCTTADRALDALDALASRHRMVDLYWYPRSDEAKLRVGDRPEREMRPIEGARLVRDEEGWGSEVVPQPRHNRFDEMEYAVPARAWAACVARVRERVKSVHRRTVGWRVLVRFVAPDDAYLSEAHGRETATLSLHQNAGLPYWDYFRDLEPEFWRHEGRPHWGKKHTLGASGLRPLYPEWDRYQRVRAKMDPDGVFLSPPLARLLGVAM